MHYYYITAIQKLQVILLGILYIIGSGKIKTRFSATWSPEVDSSSGHIQFVLAFSSWVIQVLTVESLLVHTLGSAINVYAGCENVKLLIICILFYRIITGYYYFYYYPWRFLCV